MSKNKLFYFDEFILRNEWVSYVNCQTYTISSCFAVECQINVKLTKYLGVGVIIFFVFDHPPPSLTANIYCFPKDVG